ncbi:hypothetical protein PG984_010936 [Apiospora sp. TS-2023a]
MKGFSIHEFSSLEDSEEKLKLIHEAANIQADGSFEDKSYQAALEHGDDPEARDVQRTLKRATMMYDLQFPRSRVYYATRDDDSRVVGCATVLFAHEKIIEEEIKHLRDPNVVHKDYRKRTVATRILEHIVKELGKDNTITMATSSDHVQSVSSKLGFMEFDCYQVVDNYGNLANTSMMWRERGTLN